MLEMKKMWHVDAKRPCYKEEELVVFVDNNTADVVLYSGGSQEYYRANENDKFFETQEEATRYLNEKRKEIRDMMGKVKDFIDKMEYIYSTRDFHFNREDYLGRYANRYSDNDDYYSIMESKYNNLLKFAHYGVININANTIKVSEIAGIEWHEVRDDADKESAVIVCKNGNKIRTHTKAEYELICELFGYNNSERIYYDDNDDNDDDD